MGLERGILDPRIMLQKYSRGSLLWGSVGATLVNLHSRENLHVAEGVTLPSA